MTSHLVRNSADVMIAVAAQLAGKYGLADLAEDYDGHERKVWTAFYSGGAKRKQKEQHDERTFTGRR